MLKSGVVFLQLANACGEEKTFIHEFVLFATEEGVYRVDSYGKEEMLAWNEQTQKSRQIARLHFISGKDYFVEGLEAKSRTAHKMQTRIREIGTLE